MPRSNEWDETLEQTIIRSRAQTSLLAYSMVEGEVIEVGINGQTPEGTQVEQSREIKARSLGLKTGALEVIEDTSTVNSWENRTLCLGSYVFAFGEINFDSAGLLRGLIAYHGGVVVDFKAEHFVGETPPDYLLAEYNSLSLDGQRIF